MHPRVHFAGPLGHGQSGSRCGSATSNARPSTAQLISVKKRSGLCGDGSDACDVRGGCVADSGGGGSRLSTCGHMDSHPRYGVSAPITSSATPLRASPTAPPRTTWLSSSAGPTARVPSVRCSPPHGTLIQSYGDGSRLSGALGNMINAPVLSLFVCQALKAFNGRETTEVLDEITELIEAGQLTPSSTRPTRCPRPPKPSLWSNKGAPQARSSSPSPSPTTSNRRPGSEETSEPPASIPSPCG